MAVLNTNETVSNLLKKGFVQENNDHKFLSFNHGGKHILHTKVSHSGKDLDDYLIAAMSKQCKLTSGDFKKFAKCDLSEEEYVNKLIAVGAIEVNQTQPQPTQSNQKESKNRKHKNGKNK